MYRPYKKILVFGVLGIFLHCATGMALTNTLKNPFSKHEPHLMYHHGFGDSPSTGQEYAKFLEVQSHSAPSYENDLLQASFYTQESQKRLLKDMSDQVKQGKSAISNIGFSMGGGTAINLLDKLIDYEHNKDFFKGTDVTSAQDAQKLLNAINRGKQTFSKPALSMHDTAAARMFGSGLSALTFAGLTAAAYYSWVRYNKKQAEPAQKDAAADQQKSKGKKDTDTAVTGKKRETTEKKTTSITPASTSRIKDLLVKIGIIGLGGAAWYLLGDTVSRGYTSFGVNVLLPRITGGQFNSADTRPEEALKRVITSGKYTAPTLWHFSRNDEILPGQTEKKVQGLFENKNPQHEVIFTDESHNELSREYLEKLKSFHAPKK